MLELLSAEQNLPFAVALAVMCVIALLEGVGMLFGAGLSNIIGGLFPDSDVQIDSPDLEDTSTLGAILSWLRVGQVPVIILLILFLVSFALIGLTIQQMVSTVSGFMLPAFAASVVSFGASLPAVRFLGGILHRIMPKDETSAVSKESFIGRVAVITLGTARGGHAAQAKLRDSHGQDHYVMVEPDNAEERFEQGSSVLLVRQAGAVFYGIDANLSLTGDGA